VAKSPCAVVAPGRTVVQVELSDARGGTKRGDVPSAYLVDLGAPKP